MKEIKLSQRNPKNKGKYVALVDDEDYDYINQWKWSFQKIGFAYYALRREIVDKVGRKRKVILMHRVILNCPKGMQVDHKNHDGLDNRRCNIRICSVSENRRNRTPIGTSKFLGVHLRKDVRINVWHAQIHYDGNVHGLGSYAIEEDAARAYDKRAKEHHGEFANLNFPDE
jgi:hypothetical protein